MAGECSSHMISSVALICYDDDDVLNSVFDTSMIWFCLIKLLILDTKQTIKIDNISHFLFWKQTCIKHLTSVCVF